MSALPEESITIKKSPTFGLAGKVAVTTAELTSTKYALPLAALKFAFFVSYEYPPEAGAHCGNPLPLTTSDSSALPIPSLVSLPLAFL